LILLAPWRLCGSTYLQTAPVPRVLCGSTTDDFCDSVQSQFEGVSLWPSVHSLRTLR